MTASDITTIISTIGFPIAAFLLMFWYVKSEMKEMATVIQANTVALTKLLEHFHSEEES